MCQLYPNFEQFKLWLRKVVYPYEYMGSADKISETCLPAREHFYSSLSEEQVSDEDYAHNQNIGQKFNNRTMGQYHDLYLKTDAILLADVFEAFR